MLMIVIGMMNAGKSVGRNLGKSKKKHSRKSMRRIVMLMTNG